MKLSIWPAERQREESAVHGSDASEPLIGLRNPFGALGYFFGLRVAGGAGGAAA
jgi:hypothetical protein